MEKNFILKGNVCYSKDKENVITKENAYIICVNGISKGVFEVIPEEYVGAYRLWGLSDCTGIN